jgi:hypothetical protein
MRSRWRSPRDLMLLSSQFLKLVELDQRFKRGQFVQVEPTQVDEYGTRCQVEE